MNDLMDENIVAWKNVRALKSSECVKFAHKFEDFVANNWIEQIESVIRCNSRWNLDK